MGDMIQDARDAVAAAEEACQKAADRLVTEHQERFETRDESDPEEPTMVTACRELLALDRFEGIASPGTGLHRYRVALVAFRSLVDAVFKTENALATLTAELFAGVILVEPDYSTYRFQPGKDTGVVAVAGTCSHTMGVQFSMVGARLGIKLHKTSFLPFAEQQRLGHLVMVEPDEIFREEPFAVGDFRIRFFHTTQEARDWAV